MWVFHVDVCVYFYTQQHEGKQLHKPAAISTVSDQWFHVNNHKVDIVNTMTIHKAAIGLLGQAFNPRLICLTYKSL